MTRVLVAGVSTRALAASAARAGLAVTALDGFGDRDQHEGVRAVSLPRDLGVAFGPAAVVRAAGHFASDAIAYLAPFENHPGCVEALGRGRDLWGNRPEVLRRVRDPFVLMPALQAAGFRTPRIHRTAPDRAGLDLLVKTLASGGGQGVRPWVHGRRLPAGTLLQERISGVPASVTFLALRGTVLPVGLSRQLVGDAAFGATGYRYCGSLVAWHGRADGALEFAPGTAARAHALAAAASAAFGLVGLNGLDFIATEDGPVPVEVNPRWCGSLEPMDRRLPSPLFAAHVTACQGTVPARLDPPAAAPVLGKAIVFARQSVNVGDTQPWLDDPDIRDVPHPGDWIQAGSPACTVFAEAESPEACYRALVGRARRVYGDMHGWREASAL